MYGPYLEIMDQRRRLAVQHEQRPSGRQSYDFHIFPAAARAHAGPKRFVESFFRGEARREKRSGVAMREAVIELAGSKQPLEAAITVALNEALQAGDRHQIETSAQYHWREYMSARPHELSRLQREYSDDGQCAQPARYAQ